MAGLTITIEGETDVIVTRHFAAPPERLFAAFTTPALIQNWALGPEGWRMPVCECDARPGGTMRYEWENGEGQGFHLTGEFIALEPPSRIEHVERMFLPDPTPDNVITTTFQADGTGTMMVMRMRLPNADVRLAMLNSGMEFGMEASYARLETLL